MKGDVMKKWTSLLIACVSTGAGITCYWLLQQHSCYFRIFGTALGAGIGAWGAIILTKKRKGNKEE
jgi:hypothetical protein